MNTDIIIIGGGPAGLTAALYAARAGRRVLLLEAEACGGQISHAARVENYPGIPEISGLALSDRMLEQVLAQGVTVEPDRAQALSRTEQGWQVTAEFGVWSAPAVILALGAQHKQLGIPGEAERIGSGVSFCAVCDGSFYAGRTVAVVGGGNAALQDARYLSGICRQVYLIHRRGSFRGEAAQAAALQAAGNVTLLLNTRVTGLRGDQPLTLHLDAPAGEDTLTVDGLFEAVGQTPATAPFAGLLDLTPEGYVLTGENGETKAPGLFAAGDCRQKTVRQLTTAVSDGAAAALAACRYLK